MKGATGASSQYREELTVGADSFSGYAVLRSEALRRQLRLRQVKYTVYPEVGRIEAAFFQPHAWKPEYPNPAFERTGRRRCRRLPARLCRSAAPQRKRWASQQSDVRSFFSSHAGVNCPIDSPEG